MISIIGSLLKLVIKSFSFSAGCCYNIISFTLFSPVLGLIYPLYASVRAIESSQGDDKQWLTYWVIYSLITLIELTFYSVIQWIPIWPYAKMILTSWLVLPGFNGAAQLYEQFVRPYILNLNSINLLFVPPKRKEDDHLPPDAGEYEPVIKKYISWTDTSDKYIGRSVFDDDDYGYY